MSRKVSVRLRSGEVVQRWTVDARALVEAGEADPVDGDAAPAADPKPKRRGGRRKKAETDPITDDV